jgi:hypothetical protein
MVLLIYCGLIALCVGGLSGYHSKLAIEGQTTNEELRGRYAGGNPYNLGCRGNCHAFCSPGQSRLLTEDYDVEALS